MRVQVMGEAANRPYSIISIRGILKLEARINMQCGHFMPIWSKWARSD